jgi:Carboxypeptidase regulatory-like domain
MTKNQAARYKAYSLALAHLSENEEITKGIPAFAQAYQAAKATLDAISAADNLRQQNRIAISAGKKQFREEIARQAQAISAAIVTYASAGKNLQLKEAMNFTQSELFRGTDPELGARAANILASARSLATELKSYGISDEMLEAFSTLVAQYLPAANSPRNSTAGRKQAGQLIKEGLNELRDQLKNQLDKLMLQFKSSHPDFYDTYLIKRAVINPAYRNTQLEGLVTDLASLATLGGVQVSVKDTSLVTATLADGSYSLKLPLLTRAKVLYQKEGYVPATVEVEVKRGQKARQEVALQQI